MQEEVTRGTVTLIVDGAKLSEQVFEKAVKKFLEEIQKSQKPKIYRGRQSLKQLASRDADAITAAFQEFASRKMSREEKPSIRERLTQAKEQAAEKTEHRTIDREKVKVKDRSVQR